MDTSVQQKPMQRKPILMPPDMIDDVNIIAKANNVSFAQIVREAISAFAGQSTKDDNALLEILAESMIQTTKSLSKQINELEKRLDETHAILEVK